MERPTKEHILREITRLARENGGEPIGVKRFTAATGISQSQWMGRYWVRWSDAVSEAGFTPGVWNEQEHTDEGLLKVLARLTRTFGHLPTRAELAMHRRDNPEVPGPDSFRRRLGEKAAILEKLRALADTDSEFSDLAPILSRQSPVPKRRVDKTPALNAIVTGAVYLIRMGEFYKVGKSNDPGRREYELSLRLPEKHDVVHVIETDDPSGIEAYWHRRFAAHRSNGEWFRLSADEVGAFRRRTYQ